MASSTTGDAYRTSSSGDRGCRSNENSTGTAPGPLLQAILE